MKSILLLFVLVLTCGTAQAQVNDSLIVLYLSEPGVRAGQVLDGLLDASSPKRFDADGDGGADLILRRENEQGGLQDVRVVNILDKSTPKILMEVRDVATTLGLSDDTDLWGFGDATADGQPEAIFVGEREVSGYYTITLERIGLSWKVEEGESIRFIGAADLTGDGFDEIIITLQDSRRVKVFTTAAN